MGLQNVQQFEGSYTVLLYFTLYTIISTYTELLNDIDKAQLLYHVTLCFQALLKKSFRGR
jgi:hypothetical protein